MDRSSTAVAPRGGTGPQDLILVQGALRGDPAATDGVLGRLACVVRFVYRLNKTMGYGLPPESLEDVVQQVYTSLWPRLRDYAGSAALESWVFGFCRNCLRAESRRRRSAPTPAGRAPGADDDGALHAQADAGPGPASAAHRAERLDVLRDELERLAPVEREVVVLRHLEEWSFEQIARHQAVPASTVKDRCYRALMKMKTRLGRRDVNA